MDWRRAALLSTNKLHLIEAHLADFLGAHKSWGLFGEQGLESMHHVANIAAEKCFGINANDRLPFFMRRQLLTAFSDATEFDVKKRSRSETPSPDTDPALLYDEYIDIEEEVEIEYFDDEEL